MSTYCISDIHGHYDEFIELLSLINFQENDELYILGDIIDRGKQSAEMLWYATKEAPANIHFLLGNHEDMMNVASSSDTIDLRMGDSWSYNYGYETIQQIISFDKYYDDWVVEILKWSNSLPYFYDININGRRFILVHAGLQLEYGTWPDDSTINGKDYPLITVEDFPLQNRQAMIWTRSSWIFSLKEIPCDVVSGHTCVHGIDFQILKDYGLEVQQQDEYKIAHINGRKHLIDCGVNRGGYLAALRLDDMEEFYVKGKN